jgi:hypothetical protein
MANRKRILTGVLASFILCDGLILEASGIEPVTSFPAGGTHTRGTAPGMISPYSTAGRITRHRPQINQYFSSAAKLNTDSVYGRAGRLAKLKLNSGMGSDSVSVYSAAGRRASRLLRQGIEPRRLARISAQQRPQRSERAVITPQQAGRATGIRSTDHRGRLTAGK